MNITIRKATQEDASFLAQMILQSSRAGKKIGLFDLIFNNENLIENLTKLCIAEKKSKYHVSNFLIAELDGEQVGSLCSFEPRISTQESFINVLAEIGVEEEHIKEELEIFHSCDFTFNTRTLMFDCMEEKEGFIDVGVLKALMQKSLLNARLKGYRVAQTVVEIGALDMILFYKKLGFKEVKEQECEAYREKYGRSGLMLLAIEF